MNRISIIAMIYLFMPFAVVFADGADGEITILSEADWVGPLIAVLIITAAIIIAKVIKKK